MTEGSYIKIIHHRTHPHYRVVIDNGDIMAPEERHETDDMLEPMKHVAKFLADCEGGEVRFK